MQFLLFIVVIATLSVLGGLADIAGGARNTVLVGICMVVGDLAAIGGLVVAH